MFKKLNLQFFAETLKSNLIIPQVMADYIEEKLTDNIVFAPLAEVDTSLAGGAGDTVTLPKYAYIGAASVVNENGQIVQVALTASSVTKTVHKLAKGVTITDEAKLSGYGDPVSEAGDQLVKAIADAADAEFVTEMGDATLKYGVYNAGLSADTVAEALELFGEDQGGPQTLIIPPADMTALRKDDDFTKASELQAEAVLIKGNTVGEIWGCQLVPSNRLKPSASAKNRKSYIVRPGALGLVMKKDVAVEESRNAEYARTSYFATKHAVPYLRDDSKCVEIVNYTALDTIASSKVVSTAGAAANGTLLAITEPVPSNTKLVYKLGSSDVTPTFGTALSGYTDWVDATTEIAASASTKACVALVWAADSKPLKYINVTLVKGA